MLGSYHQVKYSDTVTERYSWVGLCIYSYLYII